MQTPVIGQYDTAVIAEKFKYQKPKATAIALPAQKPKRFQSLQHFKQSQPLIIKKEESPSFERQQKEYKKRTSIVIQ